MTTQANGAVVDEAVNEGETQGAARFEPAMPLELVVESPHNPRKRFDPAQLEALAQSIREKGVLTPVLVRQVQNQNPERSKHLVWYELAAGHRRSRAARMAGLEAIPAVIREMTDQEFLEVLVIENDQREDVHPLEEAAGYQALTASGGYDVARIAERVGRSVKYVYDRLKLLQLTPAAQKLFLEDRFTAAHAILLARLSPAKQEEALEVSNGGGGGLFAHEGASLFDDDPDADDKIDSDPYYGMKPRSVREFETWINRNVRADRLAVDPVLFPETAALVSAAVEAREKVIPIMHLSQRPEAARTGDKVLTASAWKRADGAKGSKTCIHSELGVVEIGPGQHEAFSICRKKDRCTVHWGQEIKDRQAREKAALRAKASGKDAGKAERDTRAQQDRQRQEQEAREEARRARWRKARPAILEAIAEAMKGAPTKVDGPLARMVLGSVRAHYNHARAIDAIAKTMAGGTAEAILRRVGFLLLANEAASEWRGPETFPKVAKAYGIDVGKTLNQAAPSEQPKPKVQTPAKSGGKPKKGTCRKCGCTFDSPCASGCGWSDGTETRCTACFPPKLKASSKKGRR